MRREEAGIQFPEGKKAGIVAVGGGEEDVRVKEQTIHLAGSELFGAAVGDSVGVEAEFLYFFAGALIVLLSCGGGEQEFCFALGRVTFDGDDDSGTDEDAHFAFLSDDNGALFDAVATAELRRDDDCAALSDLGCLHDGSSEEHYIRMTELRANEVQRRGMAS